jgi:hypothetical protein
MSAEMGSCTRTIYVELLDEGTTVVRPTQGEALDKDVYPRTDEKTGSMSFRVETA